MPEVDGHDLQTLAVALTGDPRRAAQLLGEVHVLGRVGSDPDGPEDALGLLVTRYLRGQRRAPKPDPALVDDAETSDELRAVLTRIEQLTPLARAALVLRHRGDLTLREMSTLLDRPVPTVARLLSDAEGAVDANPLTLGTAFASLPTVTPTAVEYAARRFAQSRRRHRGQLVAALMAVVALVAGGIVVPDALERRAAYMRPYGAWVHGFAFDPAAGWRLGGRTLSAGRDSLTVYLGPDERRSCLIDLVTSTAPPPTPDGERRRVQGRPAILVRSNGPAVPYLWWSVGPQAAAVIGCSFEADADTLLSLAGRVRLRAMPLRLPFAVGPVDDGVQVRFVSTRSRTVVALSVPPGEVSRSGATVFLSVPGTDRISEDQSKRTAITVQGQAGSLDRGRNGGLALCWPVQTTQACVSSYVFRESADPQQVRLRSRLTGLAADLRFAPRLDDVTTWFDAAEVLPR